LHLSRSLPPFSPSEPGSWIVHYFAINGIAGPVIGTGLVAVEVTEQRKLDGLVNQFTRDLLRKQTRDSWWLARELHDSIDHYHFALGMSFGHLTETPIFWIPHL
jgi:signal transduction histidine kinase